jgi:cohesin complex subunit SA-1/2
MNRKAFLDQAMAQAKIQIDATKAWDPYRAYEKRLSTAMSRDKGECGKYGSSIIQWL